MIIVRDTREKEKHGWFFEPDGFVKGTVERKLDTGDYGIDGLEKLICVERKESISEFAANCTQDRFKRELERMCEYKYRYIILEFDMIDLMRYPQSAGKFVAERAKIGGPFILKCMLEFEMQFGVSCILAGSYGKEVALSALKRASNN